MQIVMLDSVSMANGVLKCGTIYDFTPERAQELIDKKLAKAIGNEPDRIMVKRRVATLPHGDKS